MGIIEDHLHLEKPPVAIFRSATIPEGAALPTKGCSIPGLLSRCVRLGDVCAADKEHIFCHGGISGFGFGGMADREHSAWAASDVPDDRKGEMSHFGKRHFANPEIALLQLSPIKDYGDGKDVIVFKRLDEAVRDGDPIEVVAYIVDATRLTALSLLAGFSRKTADPAVIMPYGHACQHIYAIPRAEGESDTPRGVVGMSDIYARRFIDPDEMTFAVPYKLYRTMEADAPKSFLYSDRWDSLLEKCIGKKEYDW